MKVFYCDTETTGLNPQKNDIIQLDYIIEIDNQIREKGSINVQPFDYNNIEASALATHQISVEQMKTFNSPQTVYNQIIGILNKYINKYDRNDKFIPAGFNVKFDIEFLQNFFMKNGDKYYGSYFDYHFIDAMALLFIKRYAGKISLANYKLETACNHYGIEIQSHDAFSDIEATRELILKMMDGITWNE